MSLASRLRPPVVLAYHGVGDPRDDDPERLVLPIGDFEDQLRWLRRMGYVFTTVGDLTGRPDHAPPPGTAVLTFDDGWVDGITTVLPVLRRLGIPATFYVCPGWLGGQHPLVGGRAGALMNAKDIAELVAAGMEVASHTMRHRDLRLMDDAELEEDLSLSRSAIENITGTACRTLAYPYGLYDGRVEAAAVAAGYELSLAWRPGPWRSSAVPRLPAPPRHGGRRLVLKLVGIRRPQR